MSSETYEILALAARYLFIAAAAVLLVRSWWASIVDNQNAQYRRSWRGGTGYIGELVVTGDGSRKGKRGKGLKGARFLVPQAGMLGSGKMADIQIKHSDVRGRHMWIEFDGGKLRITPVGRRAKISAPMLTDGTYVMKQGDRLLIGDLHMTLNVFEQEWAQAMYVQKLAATKRIKGGKKAVRQTEAWDDEDFWE